jgi:hypothetical protein
MLSSISVHPCAFHTMRIIALEQFCILRVHYVYSRLLAQVWRLFFI